MAIGSGMYGVAVFTTGVSIITLYLLSFLEDKIQGRKSYSYSLVVTDLNLALASIQRILQECSVAAVSFNFKKKAGHYRVWFNLYISRDKSLKVIQKLSDVPEITQVETGSNLRDFVQVVGSDHDDVDHVR
jgi:uncharacterized membrane protein YhiD involved in acid resistance